MRTNVAAARPQIFTHEGAPAKHIRYPDALRRSVMACMLWEDQFYEDGVNVADRIAKLAEQVDASTLSEIAMEARRVHGIRHAPLLILLELIRRGGEDVADTIGNTIARPDEIMELLALYWARGTKTVPRQFRKGVEIALEQFDEYQLAKWDSAKAPIRLRDVIRLCHPKPANATRSDLYKRAIAGELETPDTWEVRLSGGADKRDAFEQLLAEGKLGYMAVLRNLRNMVSAGVPIETIGDAIVARKGARWVFPFRYVAAARAVPQLEPFIDQALCEAISQSKPLPGDTIILVDVSGSMHSQLSARSDMTRLDAAAALASVTHCERLRVFSFSGRTVEVPPRFGMAGVDAVTRSQPHGMTMLGAAVKHVNKLPHDRLIVISDEQSYDRVPDPAAKRAYMINVAAYKHGVGYGKWTHVDGFSEAVIKYIHAVEDTKGE